MGKTITEKCLSKIITQLKKCYTLLGETVICIELEYTNVEPIIRAYEANTQLLYGPSDGADVLYGFAFNPQPLYDIANIKSTHYVTSGDGVELIIKCDIDGANIKIVVMPDVEAGVVAQTYDTINEVFTSLPLPNNIVATIEHSI